MNTVRISIGRTINLGNFESLRVDVAHEVPVGEDRAAAVAHATDLVRADLARLIEEEHHYRSPPLPPDDRVLLDRALREADDARTDTVHALEALQRVLTAPEDPEIRTQARHTLEAMMGYLREVPAKRQPPPTPEDQDLPF